MHRGNFTTQTLPNFSAVSRSARKWLIGSRIETFKFAFKTRILMRYASLCKRTVQPFPFPNTILLSLQCKDIYIQRISTITARQLYCTVSLHPEISRVSCSIRYSHARNALYMYRTQTYMTQQTVPVLVLFLLSFLLHY
jgi:hypothetical protein